MRHEQQSRRVGGIARRAPSRHLLGAEQRQHVILAITPDRAFGSVERDQRGETGEIDKPTIAHAAIEAGVGDAVGGDGLRRHDDLLGDVWRKLEVPPLRHVERAHDDADATARLHHALHF